MRVNTNISHRPQQQLVLDNFGGVDFSSSPLAVASNRASFACNLINDNGINHKRPGWEEQQRVDKPCKCSKTPCICNRINGMFHYRDAKDSYGKEINILLVYAGTTFYQCWRYPNESTYDDEARIPLYTADNLINDRVQFFPHKDKVYIIGCGDYLVFGKIGDSGGYAIKPVVELEEIYVPTTTIHGQVTGVSIETGYSNPFMNGGNKEPEVKGNGEILDAVNLLIKRRKNTFVGSMEHDKNYYMLDKRFKADGIKKITIKYHVTEEINEIPEIIEKEVILSTQEALKNLYFYGGDGKETYSGVGIERREVKIDVGSGVTSTRSTQIALGDNDTFITDKYGDKTVSNIIIEYEPYYEKNEFENQQKMITNCRFGTLFGAAGNSDRLFLSGNPDYPNADFYSGFDDYTYFSAQSQTVMGSDDVPITGYVRLSDSTLATMKAGAVHEPSIYYRQAIEQTDSEDEKVKKIVFTKWAGGIGEACINPYLTASLAEDDLILSKNGVFGIVEVNNAATNGRYMRERSAFINAKLLNEPRISESVSFVYKNRYYLAVPTDDERNGAVYVADPRFKNYRSDDIDSSFNYEWWYWENVPARVFAEIDGQLWFGCEDGRICRFDDKFTDRMYTYTKYTTIGDGVITFDKEALNDVKNNEGISIIAESVMYEAEDGSEVGIKDKDTFFVTELDDTACTFKIARYKDGPGLELVAGNSEKTIVFHHKKDVCSTWYTPVFSLGATDVLKTLLKMTISVDPTINGTLKFGYDTRNIGRMLTAKGNKILDFEDLSFEEFSFASDFATSLTVKSKVRKFNYIMFKFISDNAHDCAINNFKAVYTLTASHRGVF